MDDVVKENLTYTNLPGGAGYFAAIGAGIHLPRESRRLCGFILDQGSDFPDSTVTQVNSCHMGVVVRKDASRLTTRGWNRYGEREYREFGYITPKKQIFLEDVVQCGITSIRVLHVICSPERFKKILESRNTIECNTIIWEPSPDSVIPDKWPLCCSLFDSFEVLSPNAREAALFLGKEEPSTKEGIEIIAEAYKAFSGILVIRAGKLGCLVCKDNQKRWYPAFHCTPDKVVDPTGAGNSFLGGLGVGLALRSNNIDSAVAMAQVSAGLVVEQIGAPHYDSENDLWNHSRVEDRLKFYQTQVDQYIPADQDS